jgi:hypothetical protein
MEFKPLANHLYYERFQPLGNDSESWSLADNAMRRMTGYSLVLCRLAVEAHLASTIIPQELESFDVNKSDLQPEEQQASCAFVRRSGSWYV